MGDSERNRERERPPPRWTTHTPSFSYSPFLASLFSSLFLLILRSVFSSFLLLLLRPSATRRNSSAIHEPHLARLREISRDPIRYPIFRISPLLLFRPHIASRDRFVVVRHSHLNHSCTRLSESALRVEQLTVDLNTIPTSSPARYFPISSIDSTLFHIFRHTSYYPLATTIIYISVLPRLVRHLRHYVSFFFRFPLFSSTPSSPHVHPACSFLPFVFRSLSDSSPSSFLRPNPTMLVRRLQILEARRRAVFRRRSIFSSPRRGGLFFDLSRRASVRWSSGETKKRQEERRAFYILHPFSSSPPSCLSDRSDT
jgi:hypothetical protein